MSIDTTIPTDPTLGTLTDEQRAGIDPHRTRRARVWTVGMAAGATAALATSLTAAVATATGLHVEVGGENIPVSGFAVLTMVGAVLGLAIAALSRCTRRPRHTFVTTTVTLTALSIVPDLVVDAPGATRLLLATTHVIAAAIIIPTVAHRLDA